MTGLKEPNLPLTPDEERRLNSMTGKGKLVRFKLKDKSGHWKVGLVEDEVSIIVGDYKHLIQKVQFENGVSWDGSIHGYRTGYYTYQHGKKQIKWGQYTQFLTEMEYKALLAKARAKGWNIF
jgi:hypothetical protein